MELEYKVLCDKHFNDYLDNLASPYRRNQAPLIYVHDSYRHKLKNKKLLFSYIYGTIWTSLKREESAKLLFFF